MQLSTKSRRKILIALVKLRRLRRKSCYFSIAWNSWYLIFLPVQRSLIVMKRVPIKKLWWSHHPKSWIWFQITTIFLIYNCIPLPKEHAWNFLSSHWLGHVLVKNTRTLQHLILRFIFTNSRISNQNWRSR